jgi:hypothetical protein
MAGQSRGTRAAKRRAVVGRLALVAVALAAADAVLGVACGGTTGRDSSNLGATTSGSTADGGGDAGVDATLGDGAAQDADNGAFDVVILYVDQMLPDIGPPAPATDSGWPWPSCPPFLPGNPDGTYNDASVVNQIPAAYDNAGNVIPAPDGSACATYPWLGTVAADSCMTNSCSGGPSLAAIALLPPCNWCVEAGVATAGAGLLQNATNYSLCLTLYACIQRTGCGRVGHDYCMCGDNSAACQTDASGPCAKEELAALNVDNTLETIPMAVTYFDDTTPGAANPGYCAGVLNQVYQCAAGNQCLDSDQ